MSTRCAHEGNQYLYTCCRRGHRLRQESSLPDNLCCKRRRWRINKVPGKTVSTMSTTECHRWVDELETGRPATHISFQGEGIDVGGRYLHTMARYVQDAECMIALPHASMVYRTPC